MANVLLVNAPFRARGMPTILPIHLAQLGSYLVERGHQVRVLDLNVQDHGQLEGLLHSRMFDLVGIALRNVPPFFWLERFRSLRKLVRRVRATGARIVLGGPGFSLFAPVVFRWVPELEVGVLGEGEHALLRLAEGDTPSEVAGVCVRNGRGMVLNHPTRFLPGEEIPQLRDLEGLRYDRPGFLAGIQTYRGCAHRCAHCPVKALSGGDVRSRPLDAVRDDLVFLRDRGVRHLFIIDGAFQHPPERAREVLHLFRRLGYPPSWEAFLHPDDEATPELLRAAAAAGVARFHLDVIAGSPRLGAMLDERARIAETLRIATALRDAGVEGYFYFAYHLPTETLGEEMQSLRMMRHLRRLGHRTHIFPFFSYPGTGLERHHGPVLEKGLIWHVRRAVAMLFRPGLFRFLRGMRELGRSTGPMGEPM